MTTEATTETAPVVAVWSENDRPGDDAHTNPETGKPWTLAEAKAAVAHARFHGIEADYWTE